MKFRKRPVVVDALRWTGDNAAEMAQWIAEVEPATPHMMTAPDSADPLMTITTLEGNMAVSIGDRVICGVGRELYPCKPEIFAATYEAA